MKTFEEQKAFFEEQWPTIRLAAEESGAKGVLDYLDGIEDPVQRRVLALFVRQGLVMQPWEGRTLDVYAEVARGAIDRILAEAREAEDPERTRRAHELANVISYNLAADLANCWPDDGLERTTVHFEAGRQAASDCVRWREELDKGAAALSMALWAQGMHELSLGELDASVQSFERSLEQARNGSEDDGDFGVVLGLGYLGLARWVRGDDDGEEAYGDAVGTFRGQLEDEKRKGDARFGMDQLETVKSRYVSA